MLIDPPRPPGLVDFDAGQLYCRADGHAGNESEPRVSGLVSASAMPEDSPLAAAAVEDYAGQPYDRQTTWWEGQPQTRTELETRTRTALESGEYPLLDLWYAHLLDPENYPDPTTTEQQDHRCDVGEPNYKNPGGSTSPDPYLPRVATAFATSDRPSGASGAPEPYLRYGTANWRGTSIDNWGGWI